MKYTALKLSLTRLSFWAAISFMLLAIFSSPYVHAASTLKLYINPDTVTVEQGQTFATQLRLTKDTSSTVNYVDAYITYNPSLFEISSVSITDSHFSQAQGPEVSINPVSGVIKVTGTGPNLPAVADVLVASITFRAQVVGSSALSILSSSEAGTKSGNRITNYLTTTAGSSVAVSPQPSAPSETDPPVEEPYPEEEFFEEIPYSEDIPLEEGAFEEFVEFTDEPADVPIDETMLEPSAEEFVPIEEGEYGEGYIEPTQPRSVLDIALIAAGILGSIVALIFTAIVIVQWKKGKRLSDLKKRLGIKTHKRTIITPSKDTVESVQDEATIVSPITASDVYSVGPLSDSSLPSQIKTDLIEPALIKTPVTPKESNEVKGHTTLKTISPQTSKPTPSKIEPTATNIAAAAKSPTSPIQPLTGSTSEPASTDTTQKITEPPVMAAPRGRNQNSTSNPNIIQPAATNLATPIIKTPEHTAAPIDYTHTETGEELDMFDAGARRLQAEGLDTAGPKHVTSLKPKSSHPISY